MDVILIVIAIALSRRNTKVYTKTPAKPKSFNTFFLVYMHIFTIAQNKTGGVKIHSTPPNTNRHSAPDSIFLLLSLTAHRYFLGEAARLLL